MAQRERRANAGNRMAKLLDEEEEDEFYKTTYGGFQEAEEDNDYVWVLVGSALYWGPVNSIRTRLFPRKS